MKVIKPVLYQSSHLLSTTAVETVALYVAGTTYALGAKVRYGERLYESLVASNLGNQPDISPTKWLDYAPSNKTAMFDNAVNTASTSVSPFITVLQPLVLFNSVAYLNLTGTSLNVKVQNGVGGAEVYNRTISLDSSEVLDWYMYYFEPFDLLTEVVITDIPPYINNVLTSTLVNATDASIGSLIYGTVYTLGGTQYGASVGIRDYSVKVTDDFGNTKFVQRAFSKRLESDVFIDNSMLNYNYKLLSDLRAIPAVWIGSDDTKYQPLIVYGYYRDFNVTIQYPTYSLCSLQIEGLI